MNNRRDFIKTVLLGTTFLAMPDPAKAIFARKPLKLVILHTNDTHSHLDPLPDNVSNFAGLGGVARRAGLVNKIRSENEHVLLFDSGDIFQGTPYFNFCEGKIELQLMSKLKYDAATLGNHEFDNGIDSLAQQLQYAEFPFINSNYDVAGTALENKIEKWRIIEKGNLRIGIIGLGINPAGLVPESHYKGMKYNDPVETGDATAKMLKEEKKCHFVIALSHLGFRMTNVIDDEKVAAQTEYIDLILGGHTHTFMKEPKTIINKKGNPVIIQQSGMYGICLGRLDFVFENDKIKTESKLYSIES